MPKPLTCPQCTGEAAERVFPSAASLQGHVSRMHNMTAEDREAIWRKRAATMNRAKRRRLKLTGLEQAVPVVSVVPVAVPVAGAPRIGRPAKRAAPVGGGPPATFEDALAYLEMRYNALGEIIRDLKQLRGIA